MATLVFAATNALGSISGSVEVTVGGDPAFPQEYSLSRPLLVNNPGALVTGEDWQNMQTDQDLYDLNFFEYPDGTDPALTRQVILETADPTFGTVVRAFQTDWNTILPGGTVKAKPSIESERHWTGISKAWIRYTMWFKNGFTTAGQGGGASAWKTMFAMKRHHVWKNTAGRYREDNGSDHWPTSYGGTIVNLPNPDPSDACAQGGSQGCLGKVTTEWTDEEWWEYIVYEERVSSTHFRLRWWRRPLTANKVIISLPSAATWEWRFGKETTSATVSAGDSHHIRLGVNRNKKTFVDVILEWRWGPWEVIDGDVLPDPYGIAEQII